MQKLTLKQTSQQKLTPQQIKFINLLQTSNESLQSKVEKELLDNPGLTEEEEEQNPEEVPISSDTLVYNATKSRVDASPSDSAKDWQFWLQHQQVEPVSFREHLLQQVSFLSLPAKAERIARYLIGSLSDRGLLARPLSWVVADFEVLYHETNTLEEVTQVLHTIQELGPPGIAARNLQESLLLQLQAKKEDRHLALAKTIIKGHFDAFQKKHYAKIAHKLNIAPPQLKQALHLITKLNPYPITSIQQETNHKVLEPDFLVKPSAGKIQIVLVERYKPKLKINTAYQELLQRHKHEKTTKSQEIVQFVQAKIQRAKDFMQAIAQRKKTLLKIVEALVDFQKVFFQTGDSMQLVPIFLKHIAKKIHMDVSTVSRAISNKSIQTPWGIYPMKYFFSGAVETKTGKEISRHIVKQFLEKLIAKENKSAPYRDERLAEMLQKQGIPIARRTIAKYREQLGILPARLRKGWS